MKKAIKILFIVMAIIVALSLVGLFAFLSFGRAGGEQEFNAIINCVEPEYNMAYATVTDQNAGLFSEKLPESIMFNTSDLDVELKAGDEIHGCYLSGTISGDSVRVVSIVVLEQNAVAPNKCLDEVAGNMTFYEEPVKEAQNGTGTVTVCLSRDLNEEQADKLKDILDDVDEWVDDRSVDRLAYYFDGDFELSDREHSYYFTYEYNVIYYDHYYAEIPAEDMQYIKDLGTECVELPDIERTEDPKKYPDTNIVPGFDLDEPYEQTEYTDYYNIEELVELCKGTADDKSKVTVKFQSTEGPSTFSVEVWHRASENDEWTKSESKSALVGDAPTFSVPAESEYVVMVTATAGNKGNVTFFVSCS